MRRPQGTMQRVPVLRVRPRIEAMEERVLCAHRLEGPIIPATTAITHFLHFAHLTTAQVSGTIAPSGSYVPGPLVQVSGASPFAKSTADNIAGQSGTNFLNSAVEPQLAVDPRHPNHLVGVWQQDRWSNDGARGIVAGVSFNGGRTWRTVVIPGLTLVSGGSYQRASDPWVAFAPNGTVYVTSVPFNQEEQGGQSAVSVNKSTDGGLSWSNPVLLIQDPSPLIQADKDSITTDPRRSRFAYAVWEQLEIPPALVGFRGPAQFARTTNGGRTWEPARTIFDPGPNALTINHQILVTPGGTLLDFFTEFRATFGPSGVSSTTSTLSLMRSTDQGQTWSAPLQVTQMLGLPVTDPDNGQPVRTASTPEGVPAEFASVAIDPDNGHLYAVWQDARFSGGQYDSVAFSMSTDGGLTWSTPIAINKTPTNILPADQQAFNPTIRVAADGTLAVSYYDFRNNTPAPDALTDAWIVFCHPTTPTGATNPAQWGHEVRLTTTSFNLEQAPLSSGGLGGTFGGGYFLGDYEALGAAGHDFLAFFSQPQGSFPASVFFRRVGPSSHQRR